MEDPGIREPSAESSSESSPENDDRPENTSCGNVRPGEREPNSGQQGSKQTDFAGPFQPSEVTKFIWGILADGEWHDYVELTQQVLNSGLSLPATSWTKPNITDTERAQIAIKQVGSRNSYELAYESHPKGKRRVVKAIRKSPTIPARANLKSCSRCGAPNLTILTRVRRVVEFRAPKQTGRGQGDVTVARNATTYLCIPCAQQELDVAGLDWRIKPPFDQGKLLPLRPRSRKKQGGDQTG